MQLSAIKMITICAVLLSNAAIVFAQNHLTNDPIRINTISKNSSADVEPKLKLNTDIVSLHINVIDRQGAPVLGLNQAQFEIFEDGIKQDIAHFKTVDAPASIGVIFDSSGSMEKYLKNAQAAFKTFVETSHQDDEFFLIAVSDEPSVLMDYTDGDALVKRISKLQAQGSTSLHDAIALGIEKLKQARHPKRALLVISDGIDNHSRLDSRRLTQSLKEADAQIYTIGVESFGEANCGPICRMTAQDLLQKIARHTGGESFFINKEQQLEDLTYRIALLLRQQYSIGYEPTNESRKGKWRKIEIKLTQVDQKPIIRTRQGYYN